ncbi:MAG: PhnD/SsuA/transferrin family substrate-binding protein [Actinobacteria bacterium]|nr:PhnD/SsuA/transferrin family substrate-binding protein [Actinomycetota bacterium]
MKRSALALISIFALVATACSPTVGEGTTTTGEPGAPSTTTQPAGTTTESPTSDWPERLVFGFVPSQEAAELQDDVDTFAAILSDALGITVEGTVTTDYTGLGVAMGTGQADMGAFGPAGYVLASREYENLELLAQSVRFGDSTYHGQWFTNDPAVCGDAGTVEGAFYYDDAGGVVAVGPTETPALQVGYEFVEGELQRNDALSAPTACAEPVDLSVVVGKTIAFGTETSTSGFIFPTIQLINAGISEDQYTTVFSGGHDASVQAVYDGTADIGVSFDDARATISETNPDVGEKVIVFNITPRIANDVIAIRSDLPDDLKDALFQAMADYIATEEGQVVMEELYSWTDLTRADAVTEQSLVAIGDAIDELGFSG